MPEGVGGSLADTGARLKLMKGGRLLHDKEMPSEIPADARCWNVCKIHGTTHRIVFYDNLFTDTIDTDPITDSVFDDQDRVLVKASVVNAKTGAAVRGIRVSVVNAATRRPISGVSADALSKLTPESGKVSFPFRYARWRDLKLALSIVDPRGEHIPKEVLLEPGKQAHGSRIEIHPVKGYQGVIEFPENQRCKVSVIVLNASNKQPVPGATVQLIDQRSKVCLNRGESDSNGRLVMQSGFLGETAVPCLLHASMRGWISQQDVEVPLVARGHVEAKTVLIKAPKPNQFRIVLTWGSTPKDLDMRLLTPSAVGGKRVVTYNSKKVGDAEYEVDETKGFGPETITMMLGSQDGWYVGVVVP